MTGAGDPRRELEDAHARGARARPLGGDALRWQRTLALLANVVLPTRLAAIAAEVRASVAQLRRRALFARAWPLEVTQFPVGDDVEFDHVVCVERGRDPLNGVLDAPHMLASVQGGSQRAWRVAESLWSQYGSPTARVVVYAHAHRSRPLGVALPVRGAIIGWVDDNGCHGPDVVVDAVEGDG